MLNEPAVGKAFFGREDVLATLEKRVNALRGGYRQNIALTGQMLSGKSSILYQFLHNLKDTSLIPVYIEVVEEPFLAFADKFIATLLFGYFASCGYKAEKDLKALIETAQGHIPHTTYAIRKVRQELAKKNYNNAYRELLELTSLLRKETGKSCVVILDEFHNLEFFKIKKPYFHFGKIIMIQKDTMYIVSSSQKSTIKKILSERLALLYGNFEIIEVSGFDDKTAEAFLKERFAGVAISRAYVYYLIDFTGGNPFYLDVISKKILEITNSRRLSIVEESVVIEAFISLIYTTSGTINQYFTNNIMTLLEKASREDYLNMLIALACGHNKLNGMAKWLGRKSSAGLSAKLNQLIEFDMVYKSGVFYGIEDKVFEFWLRSVYYRKKTELVDDIAGRTNDFRKDVKKDIDGYMEENKKDIPERIKELFMLFNNETVEIKKKRRKLPRFVKIEVENYDNAKDIVTHQTRGKYWVCEIWEKKLDEQALSGFIERCHARRDKISKKICVALGGIDANAILLAKEKNIWVWDLRNMNELLRLYKKRGLICG